MKLKHLIGIILVLSSIICSCVSIDPTESYPVNTNTGLVYVKYKQFEFGDTKGTKSFNWERGDRVCVYSLVNGIITYKDTVSISNANENICKIKALVDVESTQYFTTYPMNAIKCEVGDVLDSDNLRIVYNGTYRGCSIMTCYAEISDRDLWFKQRLSLLEIKNFLGRVNSEVIIESSLPIVHTFTMGNGGTYYIPISYKTEQVKIIFKTDNLTKDKVLNVEPGHIYTSTYTIN